MEEGVSGRHYMHNEKTEIFSGPECLQAVSALPSDRGSFKAMSSTVKYKVKCCEVWCFEYVAGAKVEHLVYWDRILMYALEGLHYDWR